MRKLKMAVIGAGRLGGFHAQKLAGMESVELVGVADPDASQRNRVAAECDTRAFADHRELFDRIDAAVIAAPTRLHHRLGMECLEKDIHLLIEKPLAPTHEESNDLVGSARRNHRVLQVGHVERFNPALIAALPHIRRPKYIEAVRSSGFTFRSTDVGVVLDLMIHDLDLILSIVRSEVRNIQALGLSILGGHEDVANVRIEFECGCVAALNASRVSYEPMRKMQIWSPRAYAGIDFATRSTTLVHPSETLLRRQFDVDSLSADQVEHYKENLFDEHLPRQQIESPAVDALTLELEDFLESIRMPRSPRVSGGQGRNAVAVAELILDKINSHGWGDSVDGPVGPRAIPRPNVIPAHHWNHVPAETRRHKEAG